MTRPLTDEALWRIIQPIIADGWDSVDEVARKVVADMDITDDAEAEVIRARVGSVLIAHTFMAGG